MEYQSILDEIATRVQHLQGRGKVADYIPALARVPPDKFGMALATLDGGCFSVGDPAHHQLFLQQREPAHEPGRDRRDLRSVERPFPSHAGRDISIACLPGAPATDTSPFNIRAVEPGFRHHSEIRSPPPKTMVVSVKPRLMMAPWIRRLARQTGRLCRRSARPQSKFGNRDFR